ncbi:unnamed protein product [Symbiodinium natans]|uniref:Uncharacterized protein n=1 Tax=Symbiodinium natans TaxID=878477 RepID=A0A812UU88_9DINO|nr:unnamed protein product [Symbiodinium natans]
MARAMSVAVLALTAASILCFVPAPQQIAAPHRGTIQAPASLSPESSNSAQSSNWVSPMLGLVACVLLGAQAATASPATPSIAPWGSASSRSAQVDFVTHPPVPRDVLEEKQMTKVKLEAAPSRREIAEKVRRQEMEYLKSTYVPGGPKPVRIAM